MLNIQTDIERLLAEANQEIDVLLEKRNKLQAVKDALEAVGVYYHGGSKMEKFLPKPMRDMKRLREEKKQEKAERRSRVPVQETWLRIRNALKELYPQKVSNKEISELLDIPLGTVRKLTAANHNQLKRERVTLKDGHHAEYVMTLYPSHVTTSAAPAVNETPEK